MEKRDDTQFIVCPSCEGLGQNKAGLKCTACAGMGLGSFWKEVFLYWGLGLGRAVIKLRHLKTTVNLVINLAAFSFGLFGIAILGIWLWQGSSHPPGEAFLFWQVQHWSILIFWLSILTDMFVLYRLTVARAGQEKVLKSNWDKKPDRDKLPDNWSQLRKYNNRFALSKKKIDIAKAFNPASTKTVEEAWLLAKKYKHKRVVGSHLFFNLLKDQEVIAFFVRLNVDGQKLVEKIKNQLLKQELAIGNNKLKLSNQAKEILILAYLNAHILGQDKVKPLNFILACIQQDDDLKEILYDLDIDEQKIKNTVNWFRVNEQLVASYKLYKKMARFKPATKMDRAYTAVATPVLDHFSYDLTIAAKWGKLGLCVARQKEIEEIFSNLSSGQAGIILTGPVGTGKRTIIEGVAQLMVKEDVPKFLRDKRLVELDIARLVSGAGADKSEERLLVILDEVRRAGNIILYIENLENIAGISSGGEESLELAEVLANALERKVVYALTAASKENYFKYIRGKPLGNALAKIEVEEPDANQAIQIIESKVGALEGKYKIYFSYNSLEQAVVLSDKYIHNQYLPAKAIKILEKTAVSVSKRCLGDSKACFCTEDDIAKTVSEVTKIPVHKIGEAESHELLNLEDKIHERMINQEEAVKIVASSLRRARAQLREGERPIANFLFLGPTGVGKTELAKTVTDIYFGGKSYMIRLDMSEYQHPDSIKKMIGGAQGVRGYLTEAVREKPFALILLDEFEKAHPDILNLFLQVMDDGRLTDGQGRTIDFTNAIIIATSNAGSIFIQEQVKAGVAIEKIKETLINEHLNKTMRPELINRFDGVVVFKPLSMDNVIDITELMLNKIRRMLEVKGVGLKVDEDGLKELAKLGYDPKFGARPLRRLLQEKVENKIANKILTKELGRRDTVVINSQGEIEVEKGREL